MRQDFIMNDIIFIVRNPVFIVFILLILFINLKFVIIKETFIKFIYFWFQFVFKRLILLFFFSTNHFTIIN